MDISKEEPEVNIDKKLMSCNKEKER